MQCPWDCTSLITSSEIHTEMWSVSLMWCNILACGCSRKTKWLIYPQKFNSLVCRSLWSVFRTHHQHHNKLPISMSYGKRLPHKPSLFVFSLYRCWSSASLTSNCYAVSVLYQTFLLSWAKSCFLCLAFVAYLVGSQSPSRSQQSRDTENKIHK